MRVCTKCTLPETFPGISFNEDGVCNHCQKFESFAATAQQKLEYQQKLRVLLKEHSDAPQILMAFSGGKDSTYSMRLFVEKYGASVVAFTFDNGFISPQAMSNIEVVCNNLGVKSVVIGHPTEMLHEVFRHGAANADMYPMKTMERASTICTICSGFFKSVAMGFALDHYIPMIGYGWSPGQAPIQSALTQANPRFVRMAQAGAEKPIANVIGDDAHQYFLQDHHYDVPANVWPYNVHPLAFEDYDEEAIKESIREIGWVDPSDVDSNSTNCMLNAYANQSHIDHFGFHPYVQEIANMVRQGTMTRDEGMEKIYEDQNQTLIDFAKREIGMTDHGLYDLETYDTRVMTPVVANLWATVARESKKA